MVNKTALTIIVSIILTIISISLVNVGTSIALEPPRYDDYCDYDEIGWEKNMTAEEEALRKEKSESCSDAYSEAQKPYNQYRYYIFAGIGFALLLAGLYFRENIVQLTGLATGGILVAEGIVINLQNKWIVFISLLAILAIFGIVAYRVIDNHDNKKPAKAKSKTKAKKK